MHKIDIILHRIISRTSLAAAAAVHCLRQRWPALAPSGRRTPPSPHRRLAAAGGPTPPSADRRRWPTAATGVEPRRQPQEAGGGRCSGWLRRPDAAAGRRQLSWWLSTVAAEDAAVRGRSGGGKTGCEGVTDNGDSMSAAISWRCSSSTPYLALCRRDLCLLDNRTPAAGGRRGRGPRAA